MTLQNFSSWRPYGSYSPPRSDCGGIHPEIACGLKVTPNLHLARSMLTPRNVPGEIFFISKASIVSISPLIFVLSRFAKDIGGCCPTMKLFLRSGRRVQYAPPSLPPLTIGAHRWPTSKPLYFTILVIVFALSTNLLVERATKKARPSLFTY